ncbi:MAG: phosphoribosylformylglycinamidine cyclo-ligase [Archangium gephyra]|uniref:Phosphoribosylformylglycinamidine cyclo-ligase n=1 Tax=Archangium gephyra TaxID=48 RepID=A0A2W5T6E9_9BACT|nr:MAG: phosphoribosylformylglycinamidine cyclo-ligase [Archangium gephyra]
MGTTYKQAGVDIEAGDALVERIKPHAAKTRRPEVLSGVGGFGGLFAIPPGKYKEPILVSGTDGVGTKLKLAFAMDRHETVGIDLVAMSVNDVLTSGAEPLFFLDYFATARLDVERAEKVIAGVARGCEQAGCTLLGGETAELPGFYTAGEYELAGFAVGIVEKSRIIDGKNIGPGDRVIGVASSGLHSNGYSLARRILEDAGLKLTDTYEGVKLGDALLEPTRIYVKDMLALNEKLAVKGMAHITGSGLPGNVPRCLPDGTRAVLNESKWKRAPIFDVLQKLGEVERNEMFNTFNMGLGMTVIVAEADVKAALELLSSRGLQAWDVGVIEAGTPGAEAEARVDP